MRVDHGMLTLAASLLLYPGTTIADDEGAGVFDDPPVLEADPLVQALGNLSPCADPGPEVDVADLLGGFQAADLILAIEDGGVRYSGLAHAIDALAVIGSADDFQYLLQSSEYISWTYVDEALSDEAKEEDVPVKRAHVEAEIRAYLLSAWASRGDLPDDVLSDMMWNSDPLPAARAIALGLSSQDPGLVSEAVAACSLSDTAAAASDVCPIP